MFLKDTALLEQVLFLIKGRAMNTALAHGHALYANANPSQASSSFGCDVFCWCKIYFTPDCIFGKKILQCGRAHLNFIQTCSITLVLGA